MGKLKIIWDGILTLLQKAIFRTKLIRGTGLMCQMVQFAVSGVDVLGASGGAAGDAGFEISIGSALILGFSFDGSVVPAGTGVLTNLDVVVTDFEACLSGLVVSSADGQALDFETGGCVDLPCND